MRDELENKNPAALADKLLYWHTSAENGLMDLDVNAILSRNLNGKVTQQDIQTAICRSLVSFLYKKLFTLNKVLTKTRVTPQTLFTTM